MLVFLLLLLVGLVSAGGNISVDWENDCFLKDGQPYRYISGGMHYFRVPPQYWADRLNKMRLAGLDTLQTYVAWNIHQPQDQDVYNFEGGANLVRYLRLAHQMGFNVVLRPGPYICAEWEFGGLPYWLLNKPSIEFRVYNAPYVEAITKWFNVLLPMIEPLLYRNGGPIIAVQIENEYAGFGTDVCDKKYLQFLLGENERHLGSDVIYYTLDNTNVVRLECGNLPGMLKALDFGPDKIPHYQFQMLRKYQPHGPLINAEFWTGWFDQWGDEKHANVSASAVASRLDEMLALNASVNLYMFEGGTNFGHTNGAMSKDGYAYNARVTSYDYDAVLTEAGDTTPKYWAIRKVIQKYRTLPPGPVPPHSAKWEQSGVEVERFGSLWREGEYKGYRDLPVTMEQLGVSGGFIWYVIPWYKDLNNISLYDVHDRATIYLDGHRVATIDRRNQANGTINLGIQPANEIKVLVESLGRVNHGRYMGTDYKGITQRILVNGQIVDRADVWVLDITNKKNLFGNKFENQLPVLSQPVLPAVFCGKFQGPKTSLDTFFDPSGWGHGFVTLNGYNLGRYWPDAGPQLTLYVPGVHFNQNDDNTLCLLEIDRIPSRQTVSFAAEPILGGSSVEQSLNF